MGSAVSDEPQLCPDCAGLGAFVRMEPTKDENGYEYTRMVNTTCATCAGRGYVQ